MKQDNWRQEIISLNEALQHLTKKKDKSNKVMAKFKSRSKESALITKTLGAFTMNVRYGNTDCRFFNCWIQNWKGFWLKINCCQTKSLNLANCCNKAELLQLKLIHLFVRELLLEYGFFSRSVLIWKKKRASFFRSDFLQMKKLEIEKTKPTFIKSVLKAEY